MTSAAEALEQVTQPEACAQAAQGPLEQVKRRPPSKRVVDAGAAAAPCERDRAAHEDPTDPTAQAAQALTCFTTAAATASSSSTS